MSEPTPEYDDNDDAIPEGLSKDVTDVMALLEWARRREFQVPAVEIGSVRLRVTDLRLAKRHAPTGDEDEGIYAQHGLRRDD